MKRIDRTHFTPILLAFILVAGALLPGCGTRDNLVAPNTADPSAAAPSPGDPSAGVSPLTQGPAALVDGSWWRLIVGGWLTPALPAKLQGSRYTLKFQLGSVAVREYITIRERDPRIVDVEFGPHGTQFIIPVQVTIDYRGTANDPDSPNYNGSEPTVFWYDPSVQAWQEIPSTADKKLKKVTFYLEHFSRYAMSDGVEDGEWQWTRTGKQPDRPLSDIDR